MPRIRPFLKDDVNQVASLHQRVFDVGGKSERSAMSSKLIKSYVRYFDDVIFGNPWQKGTISSLVYENDDGRITGFLGVMPRKMLIDGKPVSVALSSQFVVEPESRSSGVGIRLLQTFLAGPQDLSLTDEANHTSRKLWEALGGTTALIYSLHWTRLLRPVEHVASQIGLRIRYFPVKTIGRPLSRVFDRIISGKYPARFRQKKPGLIAEELSPELFLERFQELIEDRRLRPEYDLNSLKWMADVMDRNTPLGEIRRTVLYRPDGNLIGWYLYHLKPGGKSSVIQILAKRNAVSEVFDHLFYDAWVHGSIAVAGRLDPQYSLVLAEKHCLFDCGNPWMLVHSQNPSLIQTIQTGNALLTGMEGEQCMRFIPYA